jgi:hypothetical protein
MRHDPHGAPPVPIDPNVRYEQEHLTPVVLLPWLFGLFVFTTVAAVAAYGVYLIYVPKDAERTTQFPLATVRALPAEPRLQANPVEDIKTFRRDEALALQSYSKDPATGELHIPVDRALDLVAQEGLPTRTNPGTMLADRPNEPSEADGQTPGDQTTTPQTGIGTPVSTGAATVPSGGATTPTATIPPRSPAQAPLPTGSSTPGSQAAPGGLSGSTPPPGH